MKKIKLFEDRLVLRQKWEIKDEKMPERSWSDEMKDMPRYDVTDLWDIDPNSPEGENFYDNLWSMKKFDRKPQDKIFILNVSTDEEPRWFVVNTGRYDYPRYIARITGDVKL